MRVYLCVEASVNTSSWKLYTIHRITCSCVGSPMQVLLVHMKGNSLKVGTNQSHLVLVYDLQVEDYGLTSSFFPFIVAEEDVCSEIRTLESSLEAFEGSPEVGYGARNVSVEFLHEVGWLLHHSHLKTRLKSKNHTVPKFPLGRFRWLMEFSMENDWCAVVKKLLGILCDGVVDAEGHSSIDAAMSTLDLLHVAVRRNSRPMVEFLLRYIPKECEDDAESDLKQHSFETQNRFPFKPNAVGVGGLTPLHIAASTSSSEHVLDALTDDPLSVIPNFPHLHFRYK